MKLKNISNSELLKTTLNLANQERAVLSKLLWHLKEVDSRKLYADVRCGSLYEYCIRVLRYSEGQASRRVSACRMLKDIPEVSRQIESGDINLMQLNLAKHFFEAEEIKNKDEKIKVFNEIAGKTIKETEKDLNQKRKISVPTKVNLRLRHETVEALKKVQAFKAHSCKDMDELIIKICDEVLEVWDPSIVKRKTKVTESDSRYVPVQVKAEVWSRDKGQCRNCGSTYALEMDHVKSFAKGGKASVENMQLLCRNCNQRKGMVEFGNRRNRSTYK